jgi:hypothetical protein
MGASQKLDCQSTQSCRFWLAAEALAGKAHLWQARRRPARTLCIAQKRLQPPHI